MVLPVAEHHRVAPHRDLTGFAGRELRAGGIDDADLYVAEGTADGSQSPMVVRVVAISDVAAREGGNRHRALPLTVDLDQYRSECFEGFQSVLEVHRSAAVND